MKSNPIRHQCIVCNHVVWFKENRYDHLVGTHKYEIEKNDFDTLDRMFIRVKTLRINGGYKYELYNK